MLQFSGAFQTLILLEAIPINSQQHDFLYMNINIDMNKVVKNKHDKINGRKTKRSQPYTKSYT